MGKIGTAGNKGEGIRSDCFVTVEMTDSGGLDIAVKSKVQKLYGDAIRELCLKTVQFFGIENAKVQVEDTGALAFVMTARIEAAVKQCLTTEKSCLPEMLPGNLYRTEKDRSRRSRLYLPGNSPQLMINAGLHKPDGLILDLEDSVAPAKKEEARYLVRNALRAVDFSGAERMVRINQIPKGLDDLPYLIPHNINLILIPKCESAEQVKQVEAKVRELAQQHNVATPVYYMPIIESAMGLLNAYQIATASENVVSLAIGLEDYTADLGIQRTKEGRETFFARCQLVNAAKAAGIQPIDSVFSDVADMDALRNNVMESKSLGFEGMGCIHPRQIPVIHEAFAPTIEEIEKAAKIVKAFEDATAKGLGVVSLGSKMIDPPVVKRAQKTVEMAIQLGKIAQDWREKYGK